MLDIHIYFLIFVTLSNKFVKNIKVISVWHHLNDDDVGGGFKKIISFYVYVKCTRRSFEKIT